MSAAVEQMLYVGETPWHKLGRYFEEPPTTVDEALVASGMDFTVGLADLETVPMAQKEDEDGNLITPAHEGGITVPARATYRSDTGAVLGVVGMRYRPLQNRDAFAPFQAFIEAGEASIETCGVLYEGKRVWVLAKLNRDNAEIVPGDEIAKYLLLSHSHDGSLAVHYGLTPIRVVCANTEAMARNSNASSLFRLKHTENIGDKLEDVSRIINVADARFEATVEQYRALAQRGIRQQDLEKYVKVVLGVDPDQDEDEISTRMKNTMAGIIEKFEGGLGNTLPGVKGTWWAAYNAMTEHLSHERGRTYEDDPRRTLEGRMNQLWFGQAANTNQLALDTAVEMATGSLQAVA